MTLVKGLGASKALTPIQPRESVFRTSESWTPVDNPHHQQNYPTTFEHLYPAPSHESSGGLLDPEHTQSHHLEQQPQLIHPLTNTLHHPPCAEPNTGAPVPADTAGSRSRIPVAMAKDSTTAIDSLAVIGLTEATLESSWRRVEAALGTTRRETMISTR